MLLAVADAETATVAQLSVVGGTTIDWLTAESN